MAEKPRFDPGIPEDVQYLDFGVLVLGFLKSGKVLLIPKGGREGEPGGHGAHLTLHPGGASGIMDVHVTEPGAENPHRTILAMRTDRLEELIGRALPVADGFLRELVRRTFRRVRPGWLRHHGIFVFPFLPQGPGGLEWMGSRKGSRWVLDHGRLAAALARPLDRRELLAAPDGPFNLLRRGSEPWVPYGVLLKETNESGRVYFFWVKTSRMMAELTTAWKRVQPEVLAYLIDLSEMQSVLRAPNDPDGR